MKKISLTLCLVAASLTTIVGLSEANGQDTTYFPTDSEWKRVEPKEIGWDSSKLEAALEFAGTQKSSGVVVLHRGKILAEKYWKVQPSRRYSGMSYEKNSEGNSVEDVASVQKSVAATLLGVAIDKKLVNLDDSVTKHLGEGWSRAKPKQEAAIKVHHVVSMSTGLKDDLSFAAAPGTKWRYNTNAYSRVMTVLEAASKMDRNELTNRWLVDPIGMKDSSWKVRPFAKSDPKTNRHGFVTTARDLARFGLLVESNGDWNGKAVVLDKDYLSAMSSPSQNLNPSYGYLWWLNGQKKMLRQGRLRDGPLMPDAPQDLFAAFGALGRKVYVVRSHDLVVTRLGDAPGAKFDNQFWKLLMSAAPSKK